MSSITNINNNTSVVNVGRTTPVQPGRTTADRSIPVVLASDQSAVPVEEQNKIQSEVALSLLGIPRSEVALGIFADVNTYDVNPSEWSSSPSNWVAGYGIRHLPNEAGALIEAPRNENAILTSKRFFRYQPGRVSAATFGVKSTITPKGAENNTTYEYDFAQNPVIRKYGIFDNFDGYYWENRQTGEGDNFTVVRRSQSLLKGPITPFGQSGNTVRGLTPTSTIPVTQNDDYRYVGKAPNDEAGVSPNLNARSRQILSDSKYDLIEDTYAAVTTANATFYSDLATAIGGGITAAEVEAKCKRDVDLWLDFIIQDLEWGGNAHVYTNLTNFQNAVLPDTSYENAVYDELKVQVAALSLPDSGATDALIDIIITAFPSGAPGSFVEPSPATVQSALTGGGKPKLETIFDVKKYFWAYIVSTFNANGSVATYDVPGAFTEEELKNKCQRDMIFILDGYKNDILGGGNAETKYNMSMYFKADGLAIYTQTDPDSDHAEPVRHAFLQALVAADLTGDETVISTVSTDFTYETGTGFGYSTGDTEYTRFVSLSDSVIANFDDEDTSEVVVGNRGYAGNLVVYRDGLVMTHAGVYDPSVLKDKEDIAITLRATDNEITIAKGTVRRGQHIRYTGPNVGGLIADRIYKVVSVTGRKGNTFTLEHVYDDGTFAVGDPVTWTVGNMTGAAGITTYDEVGTTDGVGVGAFVQTVVPFIIPEVYDPAVYRGLADDTLTDFSGAAGAAGRSLTTRCDDLDVAGTNDQFPRGMMFPYAYSDTVDLESNSARFVGYINTADTDFSEVRSQIDGVNFNPAWINWVKENVKPEFYGVYEYRVPRSRFSQDRLDGVTPSEPPQPQRRTVFSDRAVNDSGSTAYPGELYKEDNTQVYAESVFDYDFTKVTMLKIEFSWYGAVGALFLAYVPVGNGEARWVRVHHLRASNQLKISSLGNATLPITYNVYGGGDDASLGNDIDLAQGYESTSHNIVKYGASYYIDGGDRGTVRLYSHNNDTPVEAVGKQWTANTAAALWTPSTKQLELDVTAGANVGVDPTFFMNARIDTGSRVDNNIRVIWADATNLYLSAIPNGWGTNPTTSSITLIPDRAASVFGLETKQNIVSQISRNSVRNRVQVYPTKLSASNLGNNPLRLRMKKTPIFQTDVTTSGTLGLSATYEVTSEKLPLSVNESGTYLVNGEDVYGWFQARLNTPDSGEVISVFGRLFKQASQYHFEPLETYPGTVYLLDESFANFLVDLRFDSDGNTLSGVSKSVSEKEGLSSILISDETQVPIPATGINIATLYLQEGTEQFDLLSYFDYNKEYLSFPLTDQADTLYFVVDSDTSSATSDQVSLGVTWEEQ